MFGNCIMFEKFRISTETFEYRTRHIDFSRNNSRENFDKCSYFEFSKSAPVSRPSRKKPPFGNGAYSQGIPSRRSDTEEELGSSWVTRSHRNWVYDESMKIDPISIFNDNNR